jgi:hypothetical protein
MRTELYKRLAAVAADVPYLRKDATNAHFQYSYVSEAKVKADLRASLARNGLVLVGCEARVQPGSTATNAAVEASLEIACVEGGPSVRFGGAGGDADKGGKAVMKALAAAIKYALTTGFLIPTGDDPEANREADELAAEAPKTKARTKRAAGADDGADW